MRKIFHFWFIPLEAATAGAEQILSQLGVSSWSPTQVQSHKALGHIPLLDKVMSITFETKGMAGILSEEL